MQKLDRSQSVMQTVTVKGTVLDANNEPIIGASVLMKGTTNGTITDIVETLHLAMSIRGLWLFLILDIKQEKLM